MDTVKVRLNAFAAALFFASVVYAVSPSGEVVALIDGEPISGKDLHERAASQLRELDMKAFGIQQQELQRMVNERLLNREASRRRISVQQLLDRDVYSVIAKPTASDIENYYSGIKDRIGQPLEEVRSQIADYLTESRRRAAYDSYLSQLRSRAKVIILLAPPRANVSIDPTRVRGPKNAPITIVEFSDYECPYCGRAEDTLRQLAVKYPTEVRLAYRDFPLNFHPRARPSAEASRCALAQGKFWEYHDTLFAHQDQLQNEDLLSFAAQLGMDTGRFKECLAQGTFAADVQQDVDEGETLGIAGTPAFFINGIALDGAVPLEGFASIIDGELEREKATK
jgi:protein-disulfide isomerase